MSPHFGGIPATSYDVVATTYVAKPKSNFWKCFGLCAVVGGIVTLWGLGSVVSNFTEKDFRRMDRILDYFMKSEAPQRPAKEGIVWSPVESPRKGP